MKFVTATIDRSSSAISYNTVQAAARAPVAATGYGLVASCGCIFCVHDSLPVSAKTKHDKKIIATVASNEAYQQQF